VAEEGQGKTKDSKRLQQEAQELSAQMDAKDAARQELQAAKQHIEQELAGQAQRRAEAEAQKAKYEAGLQQALAAAEAVSGVGPSGSGDGRAQGRWPWKQACNEFLFEGAAARLSDVMQTSQTARVCIIVTHHNKGPVLTHILQVS
jgi:hypothetical protein